MPPITVPRDRLRLAIGDTTSPFLLADDELDTFLAERADNINAAAADACDTLAARFASAYDFEWQGGVNARGKYNRSQLTKHYSDLAKTFRARAAADASNGGGLPLYSFPVPAPVLPDDHCPSPPWPAC